MLAAGHFAQVVEKERERHGVHQAEVEEAVVHFGMGSEPEVGGQATAVGNRKHEEPAFEDASIHFHAHGARPVAPDRAPEGGQVQREAAQAREVARLDRHPGVEADPKSIPEAGVAGASQVDASDDAAAKQPGRAFQIAGDAEGFDKVVARADRKDGESGRAPEQAVEHLEDRAVPTDGDDHLRTLAGSCRGEGGGVARRFGNHKGVGQPFQQRRKGGKQSSPSSPAGPGVDDDTVVGEGSHGEAVSLAGGGSGLHPGTYPLPRSA